MIVYFRFFPRVFLIKHPTSEFEWRFVENLPSVSNWDVIGQHRVARCGSFTSTGLEL